MKTRYSLLVALAVLAALHSPAATASPNDNSSSSSSSSHSSPPPAAPSHSAPPPPSHYEAPAAPRYEAPAAHYEVPAPHQQAATPRPEAPPPSHAMVVPAGSSYQSSYGSTASGGSIVPSSGMANTAATVATHVASPPTSGLHPASATVVVNGVLTYSNQVLLATHAAHVVVTNGKLAYAPIPVQPHPYFTHPNPYGYEYYYLGDPAYDPNYVPGPNVDPTMTAPTDPAQPDATQNVLTITGTVDAIDNGSFHLTGQAISIRLALTSNTQVDTVINIGDAVQVQYVNGPTGPEAVHITKL